MRKVEDDPAIREELRDAFVDMLKARDRAAWDQYLARKAPKPAVGVDIRINPAEALPEGLDGRALDVAVKGLLEGQIGCLESGGSSEIMDVDAEEVDDDDPPPMPDTESTSE